MRRTLTVAGLVLVSLSPVAGAGERYGLYIAPGAVDIDHKVLRIKHSVFYYVPEAYPAKDTLAFIQRSLAEAGWRPTTCADLSKAERSSHESGWEELPSGEGVPVRLWSATWMNARGDRVSYSLGYGAITHGGLKPTHLQVGAWYQDKKLAERSRAESDARMETTRQRYPYLRVKPCLN